MRLRNTPLKQTTNLETIPGYDAQGRKGQITINRSSSPSDRTNFSSDPVERAKQKQWIKDNPELYKELLEKKKKARESQSKEFKPDTYKTEGKKGTMVDTSTAPSYRGISRTGKKAGKDVRRAQIKLSKFADLSEAYNDDGSLNVEKIKMKEGSDRQKAKFNERLGEYMQAIAGRKRIQAAADAGKDVRNTAEFEFGTQMTGPTKGGETKDVMITEKEKQSGDFTDYEGIETYQDREVEDTEKPIMEDDDTPAEMKSSAFKMKYSHSPNKMYKQAKEKSSALKMWGANKVEDGNKLFFDKSLFNSQNRATRPMTKKASAFKMKGYGK